MWSIIYNYDNMGIKESMMKLKLKQKKVILGITCGVMVIGLCALSFTKKDKGNDATEAGNAQEASATPGATGEATPAPTENPVLTGTLEKNAHEDINALIGTYLKASVEADIDTLHTVVSETEQVTKEELQRWYEYVEEIKNIDCYTLPGPDEGSYIVYVYYEMKIVDIETLAPGLIQLYVCKAEDDNYVILINQLDEVIQEARNVALEREDVQNLIATVNNNLNEAVAADEKLKSFVTTLNDSAVQVQEQQNNAEQAPAAEAEQAPAAEAEQAPAAEAEQAPAAQ